MRRIRELVTVLGAFGALAMAVAVVLLSAPVAAAGGPTSVLVVSPESEETAALYYSDEEYGELQGLLGDPTSGSREEPPGLGAGDGRQINVTWLVHDVSPWRVDRVYPDTAGGGDVWIHTANDVPQSTNGYWHKAEQPDEVRALFKSLGVLGESSGAGFGAIYPAPWQTEDAASPASGPTDQSVVTATATPGDGTDWWWVIPGAAAGAALVLVLRPLIPGARRRTKQEPGPRQELIDL